MSAEYIQIVERVCTLPRRFPPNKLCVDRSKDPHHDGLENRALKIVFSFASVWPIWMSGSRDSFDFSYRQCLSRISFFSRGHTQIASCLVHFVRTRRAKDASKSRRKTWREKKEKSTLPPSGAAPHRKGAGNGAHHNLFSRSKKKSLTRLLLLF